MSQEDNRIKIRIKFRKNGILKFIGHLDIMRYFQKLFRRSGLDIAYTQGFHPHQIMSFANPLGVGLLSNGEYMDVSMNSVVSSQDIVDRLNEVSVEGIEIVAARKLPENAGNGMASVAMADYTIRFREGFIPDFDIEKAINDFFSQDSIIVEKKTKKGSKMLNLKDSVHELKVIQENCSENKCTPTIFMKVNAGSSENIRPELVLGAFYDFMKSELIDFSYEITREEQYDDKGISLLFAGELF